MIYALENQLFDESVEDLAYVEELSTVEAKGEFIEGAAVPFPGSCRPLAPLLLGCDRSHKS